MHLQIIHKLSLCRKHIHRQISITTNTTIKIKRIREKTVPHYVHFGGKKKLEP